MGVWSLKVIFMSTSYRAVGLTSAQVSRIFLYESFAVILSALILGFIIGIVVSITLTLQMNSFVELPFEFNVILSNYNSSLCY